MLKASQMRGRVKGLPGAVVSISVKFGGIEEAGIHHLTQACFCFFFSSCHRLDIKKKKTQRKDIPHLQSPTLRRDGFASGKIGDVKPETPECDGRAAIGWEYSGRPSGGLDRALVSSAPRSRAPRGLAHQGSGPQKGTRSHGRPWEARHVFPEQTLLAHCSL